MSVAYKKRIIDEELSMQMEVAWAIVVKWPKRCGKTTTCKQIAKSFVTLQDGNINEESNTLELAKIKPSIILQWKKPRLIDEWQLAPNIWNAVRYSVDELWEKGQYLLTGSATPNEKESENLHSWIGRFAFLTMKTMSLYESWESNWSVSLKDIVNWKKDIQWINNISYEEMAFLICRWWRPDIFNIKSEKALLQISKNYITWLCESDISKIDGVSRNPELTRIILQSYARLVSAIESNTTLIKDVKTRNIEVSEKTINEYLNILKKLYVIEEIPAWNPNIRSKTSLRASPKKTFTDPSLATAALWISPKELEKDIRTYWLLFENLVDRDLSVYVNAIWWHLNHYRDRYGLECDQIAHFDNWKYGLIETKLGSQAAINEAEEHLLKLQWLIKENKELRAPDFMMIITNTKYAYTTENWILVVPIWCLKN